MKNELSKEKINEMKQFFDNELEKLLNDFNKTVKEWNEKFLSKSFEEIIKGNSPK